MRIVRLLLPQGLDRLVIKGLHVNRASVDLTFERDNTGVHVEVTNLDGELEVQVTQGV